MFICKMINQEHLKHVWITYSKKDVYGLFFIAGAILFHVAYAHIILINHFITHTLPTVPGQGRWVRGRRSPGVARRGTAGGAFQGRSDTGGSFRIRQGSEIHDPIRGLFNLSEWEHVLPYHIREAAKKGLSGRATKKLPHSSASLTYHEWMNDYTW